MAESNRVRWLYVPEVTYNTAVVTPTMIEILRTGGNIQGTRQTVTSNTVRSNRMRRGLFSTGKGVEGTIEFEHGYLQQSDFIQAALCGTWTAPISTSATNIDAATADDSLNRAAGSFITDGFVAGMWIKIGGFAATANNIYARINAVTALKLTFLNGVNFTTEAAGATVTLKNTRMCRNGTTERSFQLERGHLDINQFFGFNGIRFGDFSLSAPANGLVTGSVSMIGASFNRAATTKASVVTSANSNDAYNSTLNLLGLLENGAAMTDSLTKIDFSIKNNLRERRAIGTETPVNVKYGTQDIDGSIELYLADGTMVDKFINFSDSSLSFRLSNGATDLSTIYTFAKLRYSGSLSENQGLDADEMVPMPFTAFEGADGYQVQVDEIAA